MKTRRKMPRERTLPDDKLAKRSPVAIPLADSGTAGAGVECVNSRG